MAFNPRGLYNADARRVFSGKDAILLDEDGTLLATVDAFQAQVNVGTTTYQPLGSPIQQSFIVNYAVTLVITECIIEDNKFIKDMFDFFNVGRHSPHWTFQSIIFGYDGSESRYIFRDCVPDGQIDLHNFTMGDIIKRAWNLHCNMPPEMQGILTYASNRRDGGTGTNSAGYLGY